MATDKLIRGTLTSCLTTELNSLANNAMAVGSAITVPSGEAGYRQCEGELVTRIRAGESPAGILETAGK